MTRVFANSANSIDRLLLSVAEGLDSWRVSILRSTLKYPLLELTFRVRAYRLLAVFLLACFSALLISCLFPLWALLLGPILYGIPHVGASFRYVSRVSQIRQSKFLSLATVVLIAGVCCYRLTTDFNFSAFSFSPASSPLVEPLTLCAVVLLFSLARRGKSILPTLISLFIAAMVTALTSISPYTTLGVLTLLHNWVAFGYWFAACKNRRERKVLWLALGVFSGLTFLIFTGSLDWIYKFYTPASQIEWAHLNYAEMGQSILPFTDDYKTWFHCIVAYAFGQSIHYFIWLKAIPEQAHISENPTSFKTSYELLKREFGPHTTLAFILVSLAIPSAWLLVHYPFARILYFALASTHGFIELAGLGFALSPLKALKGTRK